MDEDALFEPRFDGVLEEFRGKYPPPDDIDDSDVDELAAQLKDLTTATAADFGLVGDCPICLDELAPFWDQRKEAEDRILYQPCCGRVICAKCQNGRYDALIETAKKADFQGPGLVSIMLNGLNCPVCGTTLDEPVRANNGRHLMTEKAKTLFHDRVKKGDPLAIYYLACEHLDCRKKKTKTISIKTPDIQRGIELLRQASDAGCPMASYRLAVAYDGGDHGVNQCLKTSDALLKAAAGQGHAIASYFSFQHIYESDPENNDEMLKYLRLSSRQGFARASLLLGDAYAKPRFGLQVKHDVAKYYILLSAEQGDCIEHFDAAQVCGKHFDGDGPLLMMALTELAAKNDHVRALTALGQVNARAWIRDPSNGLLWSEGIRQMRKAVELGGKSGDSDGVDATAKLAETLNVAKMICYSCHRMANEVEPLFKGCSKCHAVFFCGKECQISNWRAQHKKECKKMRYLQAK